MTSPQHSTEAIPAAAAATAAAGPESGPSAVGAFAVDSTMAASVADSGEGLDGERPPTAASPSSRTFPLPAAPAGINTFAHHSHGHENGRRARTEGASASFPRCRLAANPAPSEATRMTAYYWLPLAAPDLEGDRPVIGEPTEDSDPSETSEGMVRRSSVRTYWRRLRDSGIGPLITSQSRLSFTLQIMLCVTFLAVDSSRYMVDRWAIGSKDRPKSQSHTLAQALVTLQSLLSFVSAVGVSFGMEGCTGLKKAFLPKEIIRCLPISLGFSLSTAALAHAFSMDLGAATAVALGYLYMPLCAILSRFIFQRHYGWLETHALVLLTLSILTFAELRSRAISLRGKMNGASFLLISVVLSCLASLLSEWVLKPKYCPGNMQRFYLQKVRLEIWGVLFSFIVLKIMCPDTSISAAFEGWDARMTVSLIIRIVQSWMAGVLAKHFSTVAKAVIQCLSLLVVFFIGDMWITPPSETASVGSPQLAILAVVVALSVLLYQMGRDRTLAKVRHDEREYQRSLLQSVANAGDAETGGAIVAAAGTGESANLASTFQRTLSDTTEYGSRAMALLAEGQIAQDESRLSSFVPDGQALAPQEFVQTNRPSHAGPSFRQTDMLDPAWLERARLMNRNAAEWALSKTGLLSQILCVATFILSDASRTIVYERTINGTAIVQQSLVMMMSLASIAIGIVIAGILDGTQGVKKSMSPSRALKYLPVSACFSLGQTCQIYAYGVGISAVENTVIGYSYMPLSAVLSRWIFRRVYTNLEWLALTLLVLSASAFVLMQDGKGGSQKMSVQGIIFVLISVVLSCLGSVLAEKIMKEDNDVAFYIQKVQLEVGGLATAMAMLFVSGWVSQRPNDAFWKKRDVGGGDMESGIFVAWDTPILLALVASLLQSWLGGLVAKRLSTVIRAVAQCLSLLLIYFVGDLVLKHIQFDWPQGTSAVVVALTVQVFALGAPHKRAKVDGSTIVEAEAVEEEEEDAEEECSQQPGPGCQGQTLAQGEERSAEVAGVAGSLAGGDAAKTGKTGPIPAAAAGAAAGAPNGSAALPSRRIRSSTGGSA